MRRLRGLPVWRLTRPSVPTISASSVTVIFVLGAIPASHFAILSV